MGTSPLFSFIVDVGTDGTESVYAGSKEKRVCRGRATTLAIVCSTEEKVIITYIR